MALTFVDGELGGLLGGRLGKEIVLGNVLDSDLLHRSLLGGGGLLGNTLGGGSLILLEKGESSEFGAGTELGLGNRGKTLDGGDNRDEEKSELDLGEHLQMLDERFVFLAL